MNKIDDLTKGLSSDDKQLKEAQGVRKEERSEFEPAEANLVEMVSMLERAIAILEREMRGGRTSFAQLKGTEVVVRALELFVDASAFAAENAKKLSALVQMTDDDDADDDDMGAPAAATYETHSDGIVTTLKEESFEVSFELTFAETSPADTFSNELTEAATDVESYFESLVGETFNFSVSATEDENDNESENDDSAPCERYDEWEYMNETYHMCDMISD